MLFQQLYNWIKYKTLPPSFLFKNRLFIERDSKHRRTTNNFGLIFRNSKWANYEMYNLKTTFKYSYYKVICFFLLVLVLLLAFVFYPFYSMSTVFNGVAFFIWTAVDLVDYYTTFFVWSSLVFLSIFFNTLYSYLFITNPSFDKKMIKFEHIKRFEDKSYIFFLESSKIAQKDYKWFIYNWLNTTSAPNKNKILETIFEFSIEFKTWNTLSFFFHNLFDLTYLVNLFSNEKTVFGLQKNLENLNRSDITVNANVLTLFHNSSFFFYFYFKNKKSNFNVKNLTDNSLFYLQSKKNWNLFLFSPFYDNHLSVKKLSNVFVLNNYDSNNSNVLNKSFFEFFFIGKNFFNKNIIAKCNRWLYRYSLIHRRTFKNSHKLTIVKKTINSGVVNTSISKKNIWNSEMLKKFSKNNLYKFNANLLYPSYLQASSTSFPLINQFFYKNNTLFRKNIEILSFYENSFFWFVNRFSNFNSLKNNSLVSNFKILKFEKNINFSNWNFNNLNQLLLKPTSLQFFSPRPSKQIFKKLIGSNEPTKTLKEVYFLLEDLSFFDISDFYILNELTKTNLSNSNNNHRFFYFNYFKQSNFAAKRIKFKKFDNKDSKIKNLLGDNSFLTDFETCLFLMKK